MTTELAPLFTERQQGHLPGVLGMEWETVGHKVPLLVNLQPAGEYLGEDDIVRFEDQYGRTL